MSLKFPVLNLIWRPNGAYSIYWKVWKYLLSWAWNHTWITKLMEWPLNTFAIHWKFLLSWGRWKLVLLERMLDWVFMYSNKLPLFFLVSFYAARISICIFGLVLRVQHLHLYFVLSECINTIARSLTTEVSACPFSQDSLLLSFSLSFLSTLICPSR